MAENFDLIFGQGAAQQASWSDADYQAGWETIGSTPPTAQQFDAIHRRADLKAQELNNRLTPLENAAESSERQPGTAYSTGTVVASPLLPDLYYLLCSVAGTSGSGVITIPEPLVEGGTITDGDITWTIIKVPSKRELHYRQPNTAYAKGDIAYSASLPAGYYLECVTAGTTGSGDLSTGGVQLKLAALITDGTVTWAINNAPFGQSVDVHNSYLRGAELPYSWAELQAKIQAGDFSNIYVGDYKEITLTTDEEVVMEVAGIDTYYNTCDTPVGHHVDFISRDCLAGGKRFNATNNNNGTADKKNPWLASELYDTMNNESSGIYATLPADLKPHIITKRTMLEERYSAAGAVAENTNWSWQNLGKLWLPTEFEVFGAHIWSSPGYGAGQSVQYPILKNGYKHILKGNGNGGSRSYWWELSARRANATYFCHVDRNGHAHNTAASNAGVCVTLCFRIG